MRDDFPLSTKNVLAKRVAFRCSNPVCRQPTSGPQLDPTKTINLGVAAHITAASSDGPRYDSSMTSEMRSAITNGIWLCQTCAKQVDNDSARYSVSLLQQWKQSAESFALTGLETRSHATPNNDKFSRLERLMPALLLEMQQNRSLTRGTMLIQAVLITLATFQLYNPELVEGLAAVIRLPVKSLDLVIPLVLTYLHIRLAYLVNAYLFIQDGIRDTIKSFKFCPEGFDANAWEKIPRSNALVELLALNFEGVTLSPRSIVLPILVFQVSAAIALNHALVFIYLGRLVGHHRNLSIPLGIFIVVLLGACYLHFFEKAQRNAARFVAAGAIILTPVLFLVLRWTLYGVW